MLDFNFRGIPQRIAQQSLFAFGGKSEVPFRSYVLNEDEIARLHQEMDKSDMEDALKLVEGVTEEGLKQMQDEIDFFLEDKDSYKEIEAPKDSSNPFLAFEICMI